MPLQPDEIDPRPSDPPYLLLPVRYPPLVRAWRWKVEPRNRPIPLTLVLPVANAVFAALTDTCWTISGHRRLPDCLHGPRIRNRPNWSHEHAFILPEDADEDGQIDHISIAASIGFDPAALRLLVSTDRVVLPTGEFADLVAERMGPLSNVGHAGPASGWISRTAYVPPNDRPTGPKDATRQLKYEISKRSLPKLVGNLIPLHEIQHGGECLSPNSFLSPDVWEARSSNQAYFFRLEFVEPVAGPLAFGWCCHRGLGQFIPTKQTDHDPSEPWE